MRSSAFALLLAALAALTLTPARAQPAAKNGIAPPQAHSGGSLADQILLEACEQGNPALLAAAIAEKADVNRASSVKGLPPLQELLRSAKAPLDLARRECAACLLAHGAKPDVIDSDGRTAVIYAARLGDLDTLRLLVEAEAYVRSRDRFHKSALFYAVEAGRRDIVRYLAQNGALISLSVKERRQMMREP
jgi:ankyrin repeat protein